MEEILFIGGDKRILYAAELISQSTQVHSLGLGGSFPPPQGKYPAIVLPLPFSRSGVTVNAPLSDVPVPLDIIAEYAQPGALVLSGGTSPALEELCSANRLKLVDYYAGEELTLKNALLTAEGALSLLISGSERALCDSAAVITGYGRIARYLARMLVSSHAQVTVTARDPVQRQAAVLDGCCALPAELAGLAAGSADLIINTVPAQLLTEGDFAKMRPGAVFLELATRNSPPEREWAQSAGVGYISGAGLPGKYSPHTAGEAIANAVTAALRHRE